MFSSSDPESDNHQNASVVFTNEQYMNVKGGKSISPPASPPPASPPQLSPIQKMALPDPFANSRPEEKFLDEYGPYTHDGYMAPKHIYAEVADIAPPKRASQPAAHYSVPSDRRNELSMDLSVDLSGLPSDADVNVYEEVRGSRIPSSLDSLPPDAELVYETPRTARASAASNTKSDAPNSRPSDAADSMVNAAAEYDVPRSILPLSADVAE